MLLLSLSRIQQGHLGTVEQCRQLPKPFIPVYTVDSISSIITFQVAQKKKKKSYILLEPSLNSSEIDQSINLSIFHVNVFSIHVNVFCYVGDK